MQFTRARAFLIRTPVERLPQQFTKADARLVQLGLGISGRASQNFGDLVVFISFDIVKKEHFFVSVWQVLDGAVQMQAVDDSVEPKVGGAKFRRWPGFLLAGFEDRVERHFRMASLAKPHEN